MAGETLTLFGCTNGSLGTDCDRDLLFRLTCLLALIVSWFCRDSLRLSMPRGLSLVDGRLRFIVASLRLTIPSGLSLVDGRLRFIVAFLIITLQSGYRRLLGMLTCSLESLYGSITTSGNFFGKVECDLLELRALSRWLYRDILSDAFYVWWIILSEPCAIGFNKV